MSKIAVVCWSGTGNTEIMAQEVVDAAKAAGAEVSEFAASDFSAAKVAEFDALAFGCPAMGSEVLEESEFQPMWDDVKSSLAGKKVGLFGSYGWGAGDWMNDWVADAKSCGAEVVGEGVIANYEPDDAAKAELAELAKALA